MDEQTTTNEAVVETGAEDAQPEAVVETAVETTETSEVQEPTEATGDEPSQEDELESWAANKGLQLDSDNARKIAQMARNAERAMHEKAKKASELEKNLTSGIDEEAEELGLGDDERVMVRKLTVKQTVRDFFDENPNAKEYEKQMIETLAKKPYLANDLEALYAVAKVSDTGREETLKTEGAKKALTELAQKQRAVAPTGAAVNPVGSKPAITRAAIAERTQQGDVAWLNKHSAEINQMVSDGTLQ